MPTSLRSPRFKDSARLVQAADNRPAIRAGERNEGVRLIQQALIDLGHSMPVSVRRWGSPDGIFGRETTSELRRFQRRHGLEPDGCVGRFTMAKLDELLPTAGQPLPALPMSGYSHKIRLHLRSIDLPQISEMRQLDEMQRIFSQYGIRIELASGQSLNLSNQTALVLTEVDGNCEWDQVTDEQRLLQGLGSRQGVQPNDITAYFATELREADGSTLQGCAGHAPGRPAVMIASSAQDKTTLAHEVCHVLLGSGFSPVHVEDSNNLMCAAAMCTGSPATLTDTQLHRIRASRFLIPIT